MTIRKTIVITLTLICAALADARLPAFPTAEGAGMWTKGGRGGKVYQVTNLNDSGPGSLRAAVESKGPRIVVFCVSGNIELNSRVTIKNPCITIAGQTAPGDGICIKNETLAVEADEVIIRYMRFRPGDNTGDDLDCLSISAGRNIIIDHCSASWGTDENLSVALQRDVALDNVTVQWCIISESLNCSVHTKGCHGYGSLIRGGFGSTFTFHHNLYAHHKGRSPRPGNYNNFTIDPNGLIFDFRNNVVYNWGGNYAGYNTDKNSITKMNFVGNYYIHGPNSTNDFIFKEYCPYSRAYFYGNYINGTCPDDPWSLVLFNKFSQNSLNAYKQSKPVMTPKVKTEDAVTAYNRVLADVGATLPVRDIVDKRIINDVLNKTGRIINDEQEVGGWPVLKSTPPPLDTDHDGMPDVWERLKGLSPKKPDDNCSSGHNGDDYTNIEKYINSL